MTFQLVRIQGEERACLCPWHDDKAPSLFINLAKDKAICFAGCYAGSAVGAIKKLLGYLPRNPELAFSWVGREFSPLVAPKSSSLKLDYMLGRGFTLEVLSAWEITFSEEKQQIVIPVRKRDGEVVGYVNRQVTPGAVPKYLYSAGFKVHSCLFGTYLFEPLPAEKVYLVEGPLDCLWMWQWSYKSTVALLGSNLSTTQGKLLKRLGECIVLCLDNDLAGRRATSKVASRLVAGGFKVYVAILKGGKKDVQEHTPQELQEVLASPVPYLLYKLRISQYNTTGEKRREIDALQDDRVAG